jgi:hypothetical protein
MGWVCARCGEPPGDERWCANCGLDSKPTAPSLRTPEALRAADRELEWFALHPERARDSERITQEAERKSRARESATQPPGFDGYRDLAWRARLARGWLLIVVALSVVGAALELSHLTVLNNETPGSFPLSPDVAASNVRLGVIYIVIFCAYVLCAAFFIAWTWRAYKNAPALGAQGLRYGAGWAIGGWFVPILALWRPKQVVNDIWRTSEPQERAIVRDWVDRRIPTFLTVWWAIFVAGEILERASSRIESRADTLAAERLGTLLALAASGCAITSGVLATRVVKRITDRQRERAARLSELPPRTPAPRISDSPPTAATAPAR